MDVSLTGLEPLSEEAALENVSSGNRWEDRQRPDRIVEKAAIAEAPTDLPTARPLTAEVLPAYRDSHESPQVGRPPPTNALPATDALPSAVCTPRCPRGRVPSPAVRACPLIRHAMT
ncbi:hypothetical protein [Streptomyces sp. NPDC020983]|uniref:hypothetical protein n=1 Tax=Streptomyces sp. NPDC020983 TaxID=3365106 RepID=UPI0037B909F8